MSALLTKIDELTRQDHSYLTEADECYFIGEYTSRVGYAHSATNDLIYNFKKSPLKRDRPEWHYKLQAITQAAAQFRTALNEKWLDVATLVPVPPSKAKGHPEYDDRILAMIRQIQTPGRPSDIRELVLQVDSLQAAHEMSGSRRPPTALAALYEIVEAATAPPPRVIGIFDDVLTTGCHFAAMKRVLGKRFPEASIIGFFIARRVPQADEDL